MALRGVPGRTDRSGPQLCSACAGFHVKRYGSGSCSEHRTLCCWSWGHFGRLISRVRGGCRRVCHVTIVARFSKRSTSGGPLIPAHEQWSDRTTGRGGEPDWCCGTIARSVRRQGQLFRRACRRVGKGCRDCQRRCPYRDLRMKLVAQRGQASIGRPTESQLRGSAARRFGLPCRPCPARCFT